MKKLGCAKCGKSMAKGGAKKMAKGGSQTNEYGAKVREAANRFFPMGGPTGPNYQGIDTMKRGGTKKAKFGASVPVKHSPPVGMRHNDSRTGFESVASAKVGGSLKPVPAGKVGLSKLPTAVRNKMGYQKSGGMMKKAEGGPILDKLKAKLAAGKEKRAEKKITRQIVKSVKSSGKRIK